MGRNDCIDWGIVYKTFDGQMEGCLGAKCLAPCCSEKENYDIEGNSFAYNTIFYNREEANLLREKCDELDLEIKKVGIDVGLGVNEVFILKGCLGDKGCKLGDLKPVACRIFPFKMNSEMPLDRGCPSLRNIVMDRDVVKKVVEIRSKLGYLKEEWEEKMTDLISFLAGN